MLAVSGDTLLPEVGEGLPVVVVVVVTVGAAAAAAAAPVGAMRMMVVATATKAVRPVVAREAVGEKAAVEMMTKMTRLTREAAAAPTRIWQLRDIMIFGASMP